jgi:hypothetical protein
MPDHGPEILAAEFGGPSPLTFGQVGFLLARPERWGSWLARHPDRADLFASAFSCLVRLCAHTGWNGDETLESLGCDTKTEDELSDLTKERLTNCVGYMRWVEELLNPHDLDLDKRIIVRGAARFFVLADRHLPRVEAIVPSTKNKANMHQGLDEGGELPPSEYLALGEIARAWKSAARQLEGRPGERARYLHAENPFADERTPHLSPKRLEMLVAADADGLLGPRVAARMREHVALCRVCEAAERRGAVQGTRRTGLPLTPA